MTLQRWFLTTSIGLCCVAFIAMSALLVTTHQTALASDELVTKMARADVLRTLGRALSNHRRNVLLHSISHEPRYAEELRRQEAVISHAREDLLHGELDAAEREENEKIELGTKQYLEKEHETDHAAPSDPDRMAQEDKLYENVREMLRVATEERLSSVTALQKDVAETERSAQAFSVLIVILSTLGTLAIIISLRYRLVRPVATLLSTIRASQHGQKLPARPQLSGEFGTIQRALEDMIRTIEEQRAAQLTFISGVAHDLRNPLTAMKIVTQSPGPDKPISEQRLKAMFATLDSQIRRLDHQLKDLLDSTQIEAGELRLTPESSDLVDLVRQTVNGMSPDGRVSLELPGHLSGVVDRIRLQQVVTNLVGNALKYSAVESPVVVRLDERDGMALISVQDHGIGISEDDLRRLFTPFYRGRAAGMKISGTGLGLSVARKIIVAHGGQIDIESEVGRGSTFRVSLPIAAAAGRGEPPQVAAQV